MHRSAGTLICLRKNIALTTQETPQTVSGRLLAVRLETSGPPIILFSTYWPSQDPRLNLNTPAKRQHCL